MTLQEKITWNINSSFELGWKPDIFGLDKIDEKFIDEVTKFQKEMSLDQDGLFGPVTYRIKRTELESQKQEFIWCSGKKVPIAWPKVITMGEPGSFQTQNYSTNSTRKPKEFVVHWDACLSSASCADVLKQRGLSVHFCIDNDGTIYQMVDCQNIAWHAGTANAVSIGVEVSNAFYVKYNDTYIKRGFGARPILKNTKVNGGVIKEHLDFYDIQKQALSVLIKTVCSFYGIPLVVPKENGVMASGEVFDVKMNKFNGVVCHYHITKDKIDCAGLDLENLIK